MSNLASVFSLFNLCFMAAMASGYAYHAYGRGKYTGKSTWVFRGLACVFGAAAVCTSGATQTYLGAFSILFSTICGLEIGLKLARANTGMKAVLLPQRGFTAKEILELGEQCRCPIQHMPECTSLQSSTKTEPNAEPVTSAETSVVTEPAAKVG